MSGTKIVLPTSFTGAPLPILRDDPILPEAGALFLLEPARTPWDVQGVPATGAVIPNGAADQAAPLIGSESATFVRDAEFTGAGGTIERSTLGGIHGIVSQTAEVNDRGAFIELPDAFRAYLVANADHAIYFSLWSRVTRVPLTIIDYAGKIGTNLPAGQRANFTHETDRSHIHPSSTMGRHTITRGQDGASFHGVGTNKFNSSTPALSDPLYQTLAANWGMGIRGIGNRNQHSSWIFYRFYMEDLTVSGRTYAEVDALDFNLFTKHVRTPGGRYYGDTFTSPSTLP